MAVCRVDRDLSLVEEVRARVAAIATQSVGEPKPADIEFAQEIGEPEPPMTRDLKP